MGKPRILRKRRGRRLVLPLLLVAGLAMPACSLRGQSYGNGSEAASASQAKAPRCTDRVDRARVGGFVGTVLGTIAASVIGSPALGFFYKGAGYVMGFASGSPCVKTEPPAETNKAVEESDSPPSPPITVEEL